MMLKWIMEAPAGWLLILGAFILSGWMARSLAARVTNPTAQYAGLGLYVVAEAVIFLPLLHVAAFYSSPKVIPMAAVLTAVLFTALTAVVFVTRKDFSFLRTFLVVGGMIALGLIVCGVAFGFNLGLAFSGGMIVLAGAAILYDTSKVLHHYQTNQHVAASLELFASVALLFWYVLRILMILNRR